MLKLFKHNPHHKMIEKDDLKIKEIEKIDNQNNQKNQQGNKSEDKSSLFEESSKKHHHNLPKYLTKEEMRSLLSVIKNYRDKIIILFLYNTGLRISELLNLEIKHLNFENNTVNVVRGKGGKDRIVNIVDDDLILALKAYIGPRKTGYLFLSNWDKQFTSRGIQKMIKKYALKSGLQEISRISPHTLRHTFAVHALDSGVNIVTINKQLGHKSLQTTLIYMEISNKMAREDLKKHQPFKLGKEK